MSKVSVCSVAVCLAVLSGLSTADAQPYPHERNAWVLGLNVGGGLASVSSGFGSERDGGVTGNFQAGYAVAPTTVLALEGSGWTRNDGGATITISYLGPAATFYPSGSGFFLRGGVGVGTRRITRNGSTGSSSGFAALVGTGNEFRVSRTFAIAPQIEFVWTRLGADVTANYLSATAAFLWYL